MKSKTRQHANARILKWTVFAAGFLGTLPLTFAQNSNSKDEVFELSPFVVDASGDSGYYASQTLAGGRTATEIINTGSSIQVVTKELLEDIGANDVEEFLQYTTGGEVGGSQGNFTGSGDPSSSSFGSTDTSSARREPHLNTRLRGIGQPDYVRNYFKTKIPIDSYNTSRVDINRGANSFLFGLGSPAGLINSTYNQAVFRDINTIEMRLGTGGDQPSFRTALDFNREIVEDKLAVRISGLYNRHKYRQVPTYKDDDRIFAAVTLKLLDNTTIRAHFENGEIMGNSPDTVLPAQAIDTWIEQRTPVDYFYNMQHFGDVEGPDQETYDAMSPTEQAQFISPDRGGALLLNHPDSWGFGYVYDGTNNGMPSLAWRANIPASFYEKTGTDGQPGDGDPYWDPAVLADGTIGGNTDDAPSLLFWRNQRYTAENDGKGMPAMGFTNLDGFDFSKHLFAGDNDFYNNKFNTYNISLEQLFFDGKVGLEIAYDKEEYDHFSMTNFNGWKGEFMIDINKTLTLPKLDDNGKLRYDDNGNVISEAMPNPNYGRPVYFTEQANSRYWEERETKRFTAYAKHDFGDSDNWLVRLLGNHQLTILGDEWEESRRTGNANLASYSDDFNLPYMLHQKDGAVPSAAYRRIHKAVYFGPPVQSYIDNPFDPSTPISLEDIIITPTTDDLLASTVTVPITYWNLGPDAASEWTDPNDPNNPYTIDDHRYVWEEGWPGDTSEYWSQGTIRGDWTATGNQQARRTLVKSWAVNLQSMFFNDHLVANLGYREDVVENWLNSSPKFGYEIAEITDPKLENEVIIDDKYYRPEDGLYSEIDKGPTGEGSFGYGGVLHVPQNLIIFKLPDWLNVSGHYNYSKNFVPDASRNTIYLGENPAYGTLASPIGEGKDYGFTLRLYDNKFIARFNWYQSDIKNGDSGLGNTINAIVDWSVRSRLWAIQDINDFDPDGNRILDSGPRNTDWWRERMDVNRAYEIVEATEWVNDQGWVQVKEDNDWLTYRGDGTVLRSNWYPGLTDPQDVSSKGFELNLTYNPTRNWRITLNASKIDSVSSNVAPLLSSVMDNFFESYNTIKDYHLWDSMNLNANRPIRNWMQSHINTYFTKKLQEGASTNEVRNYYVNLVTNYNFYEGRLKNFSVGGAVRWMSKGTVGYPLMDYEVVPGTQIQVPNVAFPYEGSENWYVDVNFGYKKKIYKGKIDWSTRVHLKNINNFSSDKLSVINKSYDGTVTTVRWDPPLEILWTNTFSF